MPSLLVSFLAISLMLITYTSCSDSGSTEDTVCYSFDKRQCHGDPWIDEDTDDEIASLKAYLSDEGININTIHEDQGFHEIVCEACFVCPIGPRYYVNIDLADEDLLKELNLLSLNISDKCE